MLAYKHLCAIVLTAILAGVTFGAAEAQPPSQNPGPIFIPTFQPAFADRMTDLAVTRSRSVMIDWESLQRIGPGEKMELNLFDDVTVSAVINTVTEENGVTTWVGQIGDEPMAQIVMVASGGRMAATVTLPDGIYQVRSLGQDVHAVQQIDQSKFPEEVPPVVIGEDQITASAEAMSLPPAEPTDMSDSGDTIDVMVVWTPRARQTAGGEDAMRDWINLAVAQTNTSYLNSNINQRIRLVHAQEVAYNETGNMNTDLGYLQNTSDAYLNEVHELRNTYGADLVSMFVEAGQYCGIAYMLTNVSAFYEAYGFSVVGRSCAVGYYSFAHELGHNMGAGHDWYVDTSVAPYSHSHGYVNVEYGWRTIMAYNDECQARGTNCTRLQYWSNPALNHNGKSLGVASGTNTSCKFRDTSHPKCDADDHRTLNDTAFTVANFRKSVIDSGPQPTPRPFTSFPFAQFLPFAIH